ncbi:MAG TPA: amidohydrolase family protein, partial [Gemmatimonadaceae bacterium]|nr:amidohydrolase family protein [Gemmatimonadaceae bacterium]
MRRMFGFIGLTAALFLSVPAAAQRGGGRGTAIQPGESCPAGTTEIRPRSCMAPGAPAPTILDYRPHSTLVVPVHMVKTAKFPAIDFHGHPSGLLGTAEGLATLGAALDSLNVRMMISADNTSGDQLKTVLASIRASDKMKDRVRVLAGIRFQNVGPGWAQKAVAQLEADVAAGAVGVGEISKSFGLSVKKPDGSRLKLDDPELDPIWDACARLKLPVFIHTADPQEFFQPIDNSNERWLELSLFPDRRYPQDRFPSFETLMTERDNLFRKHPKTTFVAA